MVSELKGHKSVVEDVVALLIVWVAGNEDNEHSRGHASVSGS